MYGAVFQNPMGTGHMGYGDPMMYGYGYYPMYGGMYGYGQMPGMGDMYNPVYGGMYYMPEMGMPYYQPPGAGYPGARMQEQE